jgi:hypothetical protein
VGGMGGGGLREEEEDPQIVGGASSLDQTCPRTTTKTTTTAMMTTTTAPPRGGDVGNGPTGVAATTMTVGGGASLTMGSVTWSSTMTTTMTMGGEARASDKATPGGAHQPGCAGLWVHVDPPEVAKRAGGVRGIRGIGQRQRREGRQQG